MNVSSSVVVYLSNDGNGKGHSDRNVQLTADQAGPWRAAGIATICKDFLLPTDPAADELTRRHELRNPIRRRQP
jgi:hypothetical protein